eukprot:m.28718 g.28718  ORF g.28718 m.28718 type:complete len:318 (-) comp12047_c0_seq1:1113-2066(-)
MVLEVTGLAPMTALVGLAVGVVGLWALTRRARRHVDLNAAFSGKVVWVTGASGGIGEALSIRLAELGADLILSARSADKLKQVAARCVDVSPGHAARVSVVPLDLSHDPHLLAALATEVVDPTNRLGLDRVDILINNGGVGSRSSVAETSLDTDLRVMRVNFLSTIALTKSVLPAMVARGSGNVVVVSSVQGKFGLPFRSSYAASKHAVHGWFDSLRAEVADAGITVTCVCPGYVATNFSRGALRGDGAEHNRMDVTTASGMSPDFLAHEILLATARGDHEIIAANLQARAAILLRCVLPDVLAWVLVKRARKGAGV